MTQLLVIEDDEEMLASLQNTLIAAGYGVETAADGRTGLMRAATETFAALIVDRMLPQLDGLGIVSALRSMGTKTPILILTALGRVDERVAGLRAGGDDYLVKPFSHEELVARLEVLLRRQPGKDVQTSLRVRDLELNRLTRSATRGGRAIPLKPREFHLLEFLMLNEGRTVTRTMLLDAVWNFHFDPQTSVVESHISRLRSKVDQGFSVELIHTVRGVGYRLADDTQS